MRHVMAQKSDEVRKRKQTFIRKFFDNYRYEKKRYAARWLTCGIAHINLVVSYRIL